MESTIKHSYFWLFINFLGKRTMKIINNLGAVTVFFAVSFLKIFRPKQIREIVQQVFHI